MEKRIIDLKFSNIAHKAKASGLKQTWYCTEAEIEKAIKKRIPGRL